MKKYKKHGSIYSFNELNIDLNLLTKKLENNEVSEIKEILKKLVSRLNPRQKLLIIFLYRIIQKILI